MVEFLALLVCINFYFKIMQKLHQSSGFLYNEFFYIGGNLSQCNQYAYKVSETKILGKRLDLEHAENAGSGKKKHKYNCCER